MLFISDEVEAISGFPASDFIHDHKRSFGSIIHPEDRPGATKTAMNAVERQVPFSIEYRIVKADGDPCWVFERGQRIFDKREEKLCLDGVIVDITERKRAEEALRESEERYRTIFDASIMGIYATTPDGEILATNPAAVEMLGFASVEEMRERNLEEEGFEPSYPRSHFKEMIDLNDEIRGLESEWVCADGRTIHIRENARAVRNDAGDIIRYEGLFEDITERKRAEEQVAASLKEKEVLLREIHHRVKNNMQLIVSVLRMHSRKIEDARLAEVFDECRNRINAMSLIHEALYQSEDLARIDFEVYLKKLCRDLSRAHGAVDKGIAVTVKRGDVSLEIDQGIAVGMVICELVSNALKHAFSIGDGGEVSVSLFGLNREDVELIVKDDGQGLPPELVKTL